jgi:taurine dioxygenase
MASIATAYEVTPLDERLPFGARVGGLRLEQLSDPEIRQSLYDLWIDKGVILFRGGDSTPEMQIELSKCFGDLEPHLFAETRSEGNPDLVRIKFFPEDGTCHEVNGELRGSWLPWHSDLVYNARINHGGILRALQLPSRLGHTGFLCQISAYERLPQELRERIEDLNVVYEVRINLGECPFTNAGDVKLRRFAKSGGSIEKRRFTFPRVIHPMVYTQAETGRKVLNVSPTFSIGIYEDGGSEGDALLREVVEYCTDPELAYWHVWQEGDMVLWDNWRVLHSATGVPPDETRVMERTTITGDYALGRKLGIDGPVADFDM